ncbi:Serine/threonine protein kinase [Parafrankia irregularis]|uniref:Serine/threonine protein kinase n=1 Tax=Parafrankia irregularis TaxID=795642 RepID=A0A0S4QZ91_9ACTN|nr:MULTISPECIES: protein kinase [Parafrankia]MBE3201433.1 protein kinase [Parafrankia sp. CH37]CUU60306.1 Serine/threonine protein kinase [Parafrankia irregularis]
MESLRTDDPVRIGPYQVVGRLGAGGMGRVYLGRTAAGRLAAVKVIRPELADSPDFRARFAREVAAARAVGGRHTAAVIDADLDTTSPWLATAYVSGLSLAVTVTRHGPLQEAALTTLAAGLAEALIAIHDAGIVHRDLKPSNVMLAVDGPKVIDFGVSRAADASVLTRTGAVIGSPGFMSPEQMTGAEAGAPSDVFSLGALVAYAATGREPFGVGPTPAQVYRVVHAEPDLDGIPGTLRGIVADCLAKEQAARPTPRALLERLISADQATKVLTGPSWPPTVLAAALRDEDSAVATALASCVTENAEPMAGASPAPARPGAAPPAERVPVGWSPRRWSRGRRGRLAAGFVVLAVAAMVTASVVVAGGKPDHLTGTATVGAPLSTASASSSAAAAPSVTTSGPTAAVLSPSPSTAPPVDGPPRANTETVPGTARGTAHAGTSRPPITRDETPAAPGSPAQTAAHVFSFTGSLARRPCADEGAVTSGRTTTGVRVTFVNQSPEPVRIYWLDFYGARVSYAPVVAPGESYSANSYQQHLWLIARATSCLAIADAGAAGGSLTIS